MLMNENRGDRKVLSFLLKLDSLILHRIIQITPILRDSKIAHFAMFQNLT